MERAKWRALQDVFCCVTIYSPHESSMTESAAITWRMGSQDGWFSGDRVTPMYVSHEVKAIWKGNNPV